MVYHLLQHSTSLLISFPNHLLFLNKNIKINTAQVRISKNKEGLISLSAVAQEIKEYILRVKVNKKGSLKIVISLETFFSNR